MAILRDLLFPSRCVNCGEILPRASESRALCPSCLKRFRKETESRCALCGKHYSDCRCRPEGFLADDFVSALRYNKIDGICRKLILSCKNRKHKAAMEELASYTVSAAEKRGILRSDVLLTYVPRSPEKEIRTGVDQAEELAKAIAKKTGLRLDRLLGHRFFGGEQKKRQREERGHLADASYYLLGGAEVAAGRTVVLIDDVVTTGATANACTVCLKEAGAARVICLAAARSAIFGGSESPS